MVQVHDKALEQENGGDILLAARVEELLREGARRRGRQVRRKAQEEEHVWLVVRESQVVRERMNGLLDNRLHRRALR